MTELQKLMTFREAIDLGKYEPEFLSRFEEWRNFDKHIQFQFITIALANRRRQLRLHWAGINNQLDYSKKPHLREAQKKIEQAIRDLNDEEEKLLVEFAGS